MSPAITVKNVANQKNFNVINQPNVADAEKVNTSGLWAQNVMESGVRKSCWLGLQQAHSFPDLIET